MGKRIGTANSIGVSCFGLERGGSYILDKTKIGVLVFSMEGKFIKISRTDAFDKIHDFCKFKDRKCVTCNYNYICSL